MLRKRWANAVAATVAVVISFLVWGIGIGQIYRDVYARAWRIKVGSVADQDPHASDHTQGSRVSNFDAEPHGQTLTRATVRPVTAPAPALLSAAAQASRVAPVVATSSTTMAGAPASGGPGQ